MPTCNDFHPTHQAQLTLQFGGKFGRFNCTACSAGMVGQAHTCGASLFTGAQIRAASTEATPDPKSPGLNLPQVDAALFKLSGGKINLDTRIHYPFAEFQRRIIEGEQAILQINRGVFIDTGNGHGNTFRGGHAIAVGKDSVTLWADDPLTGRFPTQWEDLRQSAGRLIVKDDGTIAGLGFVYASFSQDITKTVTWKATIHPTGGATRVAFWRYFVDSSGRITRRVSASTGGFSASCTSPRSYPWPSKSLRKSLVKLTTGAYKGWYVSSDYARSITT